MRHRVGLPRRWEGPEEGVGSRLAAPVARLSGLHMILLTACPTVMNELVSHKVWTLTLIACK